MERSKPIRVMVVDDHPMWRDAVARDLSEAGYDVVATAADGAQALRIAGAARPDVLDAVKAGAIGYLLKSAARPEFLDAARRTADGEAVFTPGLAALILRMVATGLSYKQIATRLVLSHRTVQNHVQNHVQNTLGKLQLNSRIELVRYAIKHGLDTQV